MAEDTGTKIKVITAPDLIFDQALSITVITPGQDLKQQVEKFALDVDQHINIFFYAGVEQDIQWLLTVSKMSAHVIIDLDNCPDDVSQFLSYLLSFPNTYYRSAVMKSPWDLLNKNRFYDFPTLIKDTDERSN
jgi:hypothetical protein